MSAGSTRAGRTTLRRWVTSAAFILFGAGLVLPVTAPQAALAAAQDITSISAGMDYSACAVEMGAAYCWGQNYYGQLGDGSTADSNMPTAVDMSGVLDGKTLTQVAAATSGRVRWTARRRLLLGLQRCWRTR